MKKIKEKENFAFASMFVLCEWTLTLFFPEPLSGPVNVNIKPSALATGDQKQGQWQRPTKLIIGWQVSINYESKMSLKTNIKCLISEDFRRQLWN